MATIVGRFPYPTNICRLGGARLAAAGVPGSGSAASEEVGEGNVLPADDSEYELFRLEGNASYPDGLYRWAGTTWIQT